MKTNLQNKMQITFFLMASKNIDFDHVCHVVVYFFKLYPNVMCTVQLVLTNSIL